MSASNAPLILVTTARAEASRVPNAPGGWSSRGEITRVTGRPVEYVRISAAEMGAGLAAAGLVDLFGDILDSRNARVTDGVQQALSRPPRDFDDVVGAAAAVGTWTTVGAA